MSHLPCLAAIAAMTTGCLSYASAAKQTFVERETCPRDRVTVVERVDVPLAAAGPADKPPAEIAADPARLALWQEQRRKVDVAKNGEGHRFFQAEGCGHTTLFDCYIVSDSHVSSVICAARAAP